MPQVKQSIGPFVIKIIEKVENYIMTAAYKCDRPSAENACECLVKVVEDWPQAREHIVKSGMVRIISEYGTIMIKTDSMAKIFLLQILQNVLQTSEPKNMLVSQNQEDVMAMTTFLLDTCRQSETDIYVIAHALDAFFDIFAEAYYNPALAQLNVVQLMNHAMPGLQ